MTPQPKSRVKEIFEQAARLDRGLRRDFITRACGSDLGLRAQVERMLDRYESLDSTLERGVRGGIFAYMHGRGLNGDLTGPSAEVDSLLGTVIAQRYQVEVRLGQGGMARVYGGYDTRLDRAVALKFLLPEWRPDSRHVHRLLREAQAASALTHPNIAQIYDVGEKDGEPFIVMEYIEGQSLQAVMAGRRLRPLEILEIAIQVGAGLLKAHQNGITHRDVKPSNIMVMAGGQVKIVDFGLAKIARRQMQQDSPTISKDALTRPGVIVGTVQYMSPEQARGHEVDPRSDIFSMGAVLYEMTTGRPPFKGATPIETIDLILHAEPEPLSTSGPWRSLAALENIIKKCLHKDRERRYQFTNDLLDDLQNLTELSRPIRVSRRVLLAAGLTSGAALIGLLQFQPELIDPVIAPSVDSIAVLPFVNNTGDSNLDYIGHGLSDRITNTLSRLQGITVRPRAAVLQSKGDLSDLHSVGKQLRVKSIITGRFSAQRDLITINTELIDVYNSRQLWGEKYVRSMTDIIALESEVASDLAAKLRLHTNEIESNKFPHQPTTSTEAYHLYMKGVFFRDKRTEEGLEKAVSLFTQALEKDPRFALASAALADAYAKQSGGVAPGMTFAQAKRAAVRALDIDPLLPEAHVALAYIQFLYDWDWKRAEASYRKAIELNPKSSTAHSSFAGLLSAVGRFDEAITEVILARSIDPTSIGIALRLGNCYYLSRQYDLAIHHYRTAIEMEPNIGLRFELGDAYVQNGDFQAAVVELEAGVKLAPSDSGGIASLAYAYARAGRQREALVEINRLIELSRNRYISPAILAEAYAGVGDKEAALTALEKAYTDKSWRMVFIGVEPRLDSLRSDERFQRLLAKLALPSIAPRKPTTIN